MTYTSQPLFHPPPTRFKETNLLGRTWEERACHYLAQSGYPHLVPTPDNGHWDRLGVDITHPLLPFHIQCKTSANFQKINPRTILGKMPTDKMGVIFYQKLTRELQPEGEYALLKLEDFLYLTQQDPF